MKVSIGKSVVPKFLSQNIAKLRPTTSFIISSAEPPNPTNSNSNSNSAPNKTDHQLKKFHHDISQHTKSIQFFTSMQFNLKTVQYGASTLKGSFPTQENISQTIGLMKRTMGVDNTNNTIIGVGSGAAIDLAKATYLQSQSETIGEGASANTNANANGQQLILVPSTLGGVLACTSRKSLVLDLHEEALVSSSNQSILQNDDNIALLVDENSLSIPLWFMSDRTTSTDRNHVPTVIDATIASLVIAIEKLIAIQSDDDDHGQIEDHHDMENIISCIKLAMSCLEQIFSAQDANDSNIYANEIILEESIKHDAIQSLLYAGKLLSFGDNYGGCGHPRHMALSLSSAILPKYFPHGNWLTFTASLLPGVIDVLNDVGINGSKYDKDILTSIDWIKHVLIENRNRVIPSLSSLADGAPNINELCQKVDDNGALLNCTDVDSDLIEATLVTSLNR